MHIQASGLFTLYLKIHFPDWLIRFHEVVYLHATHQGSTPESTHEKLVIAGEIGRVADVVFPSEIGVAEDAVPFSRFQL